MRKAAVKAFAKINLGLKILGRRSDGFHELRTVYQTISLCDSLEVSVASHRGGEKVVLENKGIAVPPGQDNLAARAATAMCEALGLKQQVRIRLTKRIPTGGGLGGGSSDAAAVLRALDVMTGHQLERSDFYRIAASIGSDVPFFLFGGRAIGVGRGEEVYPIPDGPLAHCLLALPQEGMDTAEAYRLLAAEPWPPPESQSTGRTARLTGPRPHPTIDSFCASLLPVAGGHGSKNSVHVENDFEPLLFHRIPELAAAKRAMQRCQAVGAALTGSGSAVFGLFDKRSGAEAAYRRLEGKRLRLILCQTVGRQQFARSLRVK